MFVGLTLTVTVIGGFQLAYCPGVLFTDFKISLPVKMAWQMRVPSSALNKYVHLASVAHERKFMSLAMGTSWELVGQSNAPKIMYLQVVECKCSGAGWKVVTCATNGAP